MDRRQFLKSLGLLSGGTVAACNMAPAEKLYAYLTPPREVVPGRASFFATVCRACPAGCGILVKTREARPIKLEGNPEHPVNRGALCARGQAFVQALYGRTRMRRPMVRTDGRLQETSWERALQLVGARLAKSPSVALLTGLESGAFEDAAADFLAGWSGGAHLSYEPVAAHGTARAAEMLFGTRDVPVIDLLGELSGERPAAGEHVVLSLGADLLDGWLSPVQLSRQWAELHAFGTGRALELVYAGPRRNLTANAADRWLRLSAREIGPLALALAHRLFAATQASLPSEQAAAVRAVLGRLGPAPARLPVDEAELGRLVSKLRTAQHGTVLYGGLEVLTEDATSVAAAVWILNRLTGALGTTLRLGDGYAYGKLAPEADVMALGERAAAGEIDTLLVAGTNPAYTLPGAYGASGKLERAFVVALAWQQNETTDVADVVLPVHHPLESWGDYEVTRSVAGLMQPVRVPLFPTRHVGDLLIELGARAGHPLPLGEYKQYVIARWAKRAGPLARTVGDDVLDGTLMRGGQFTARKAAPPALAPTAEALAALRPIGAAPRPTGTLDLITPATAALYDGRHTAEDWLLETPESMHQTAWEIPAELSADAAAAAGVADGDAIELTSPHGRVGAVALVDADLPAGTVAYRLGGGRPFAKEPVTGDSVLGLLSGKLDPASGGLAWADTGVAVRRLGERGLSRATAETHSEGRYLCLAMSLADAKAGRFPRMTVHGEQYPDEAGSFGHGEAVTMPHEEDPQEGTRPRDNIITLVRHPEHRWGMVVDLDRCTGCGACVVACYAENNIPVVGREEILKGRELSWLRLEKHEFGEGPRRQLRFLPVMCQHCDQAPCESVCPVFAPYHTADGLNGQVYNRCVGTRFCSNNCPYKVRRFNYFDYPRESPANEQLNPDVTVRPRGVMEKCTFCIQRIREVTNRAKADGRTIADGDIVPACVQTCPTGALTFGDFKLPTATMTQLAQDPRGYRLLDYMVNTRPGVVYLRKVVDDLEEVRG